MRPTHDHRHLVRDRPARHRVGGPSKDLSARSRPLPVRIGVLARSRSPAAWRCRATIFSCAKTVGYALAFAPTAAGRDPTDSSWPGRTLGGRAPVFPSDCVVGPDGRLWITDPTGRDLDHRATPGNVWALDLATHSLEPMVDGVLFLNGIEFSTDARSLFVGPPSRRPERKCRCPSRSGKPPLG